MAYTTVADVASEFKSISFTASTTVTSTEVTEFISQTDAIIDGKVGRKYQVPVTGTESLKILKNISTWIVADRVREIMQVKNIGESELQQGTRPFNSAQTAFKMLDKIVAGTLLLSDQDLVDTREGVRSSAVDADQEFEFKKDQEQW